MRRGMALLSLSTLLAAAFSILSFSACSGPDHAERVSRVDSLQQRLSRLKERTATIDTGRTMKLRERIEEELRIFKDHYPKDSMGEDLFQALDDHRRTRKALEGYSGVLERVTDGIQKSESKLKALKKDLKKGRHSKKEAEKYLQDEEKVLERLESSVDELKKRTRAAFENYGSYSGVLREHLTLPDSVTWPSSEKQ